MSESTREHNPAQHRFLQLLGKSDVRHSIPEGLDDELRSELETAVAPFMGVLPDGKSYENRLFLSKQGLSNVLSCEAYFLDGQEEFEWSVPKARGSVVHKAIEISIHLRHPMAPADIVEEAISRLSNDLGKGLADFLVSLDETDRALLVGQCASSFARFGELVPPIKKSWTPGVESAVTLNLCGNRIRVSGKVDLALGRPPDKVIIDVKTGTPFGSHRDDLRLYALLDLLAVGVAPRKVASVYLDSGEVHAEDVTESLLRAAARRLADGLTRTIELKYAKAEPARRPGNNCRWCTLRDSCAAGQAHLAAREQEDW